MVMTNTDNSAYTQCDQKYVTDGCTVYDENMDYCRAYVKAMHDELHKEIAAFQNTIIENAKYYCKFCPS